MVEIDFSSGAVLFANAVVYPEWVYGDQPRPAPIKEEVFLTGTPQESVFLPGTPDSQ